MVDRADVVAAHRQLREASDAVQHLLVVEDLTQQQIDDARDRLARAYQRVKDVDEAVLPSDLTKAGLCFLALQFRVMGQFDTTASGPAAPQPYDPCSVSDYDRVVLHNPNAMPVQQASLITTRRPAALARR
jgi:hypothetical protein